MFSLKKTTSYALLFVIGLMAQNIDAAKYMLGIRQAGEPMWGAIDSGNIRVAGQTRCLSVLMVEDTEMASGFFKLIESKPSKVVILDVEDNPYWQVCIPNASARLLASKVTMKNGDLVDQLRDLLGMDSEFVVDPLSWHLYPYKDLLCEDALAKLCAEVGVKKSPGHRRSHSSGELDAEADMCGAPVVAVYGAPKGARRLAFFGSLPRFGEEAAHAPRRADDDDEDGARKTSMPAGERQALLISVLKIAGIEGGVAEEGDDSGSDDDGNEADDDAVNLGSDGDTKNDTSEQMGEVD